MWCDNGYLVLLVAISGCSFSSHLVTFQHCSLFAGSWLDFGPKLLNSFHIAELYTSKMFLWFCNSLSQCVFELARYASAAVLVYRDNKK